MLTTFILKAYKKKVRYLNLEYMAMTLFRHALTLCAWGYRLPQTTDITTQTEHLIYRTVLFCLIWIIN